MKKKKFGFSLAEVLLALGIISIIVTMGYTATKKSVDNAYDLYYYTAYKGLYDVFQNAKENDISMDDREQFLDYLAQNLVGGNHVDNTMIVTAANGISYTFTSNGRPDLIHVTVPAKRDANNNSGNMCLYYSEADNGNFSLIPTENWFEYLGCPTSMDFSNRPDILPFYIDDGITGRNPLATDTINYGSFNANFCRVHASYAKLERGQFESDYKISKYERHATGGTGWWRPIIKCSNSGNNSGILRLGKPRRLR